MNYSFYWSIVWDSFPALVAGARLTLEVTALSVAFGTLLALPIALARRAGSGPAYAVATAIVEVARNTPALFQIYMAYFGLGALGIHVSSYAAVLAALTFNNAGYLGEIFRGAMTAVPPQQYAAARSLGMSAPRAYAHVIFPQIFRISYFPFVNQVNWAMLNSSLGMIIGLRELTGATQAAQSVSFRTFEFFLVAAGLYYLIAKTIELSARLVAWRMFRD